MIDCTARKQESMHQHSVQRSFVEGLKFKIESLEPNSRGGVGGESGRTGYGGQHYNRIITDSRDFPGLYGYKGGQGEWEQFRF